MDNKPVTQAKIDELKTLIDTASRPQKTEEATPAEPEHQEIVETENTEYTENATDDVVNESDNSETENTEEVEEEGDATQNEYEFPKTIAELAEEIEVDPTDLYNIEIPMPDGADPVKLGEIKNKYTEQMRNAARLEEQLVAQENEIKQLKEGTDTKQSVSAEKIKLVAQIEQLNTEYNSIDWDTYESQNPGEAALLKQKFNEAFNETQTQIQQYNVYESQMTEQQQLNAAKQIMEIIPEWRDEEVRNKATADIHNLLINEGLSQQQASSIYDPVTVKLLNELVTLRNKVKNAEQTMETVRKAPKPIKSKARMNPNPNNKTKHLVEKAKETHARQDEVAAVKAILGYK